MDVAEWIEAHLPLPEILEERFDHLWPLCRSLTGPGVEHTLDYLSQFIPLEITRVPSGTKVFDWTVPLEWRLRDAYVADEAGKKWIDFKVNNLHVLGYSAPIDQWMDRDQLDKYLHSLPAQPDAIPYLTSYYKLAWGFCLSEKQRRELPRGRYHVVIDSTLKPGFLNYGQAFLPATNGSKAEILLSTNICHPSLANNELSGPLVTTALYEALRQRTGRDVGYRFLYIPETIGSLAFLSRHGEAIKQNCVAGFTVTCCGDARIITYKKTRDGNLPVDRCVKQVLKAQKKRTGKEFELVDFFPLGSDERQYSTQGFNLPVGSLMRSMYGTYPEYHTSLDNKSFVSFAAMRESVELYLHSLLSLELNRKYQATVLHGEPMLGPRGLYPSLGSQPHTEELILKMMYVLNFSDGQHDLLQIAERAETSVTELATIAARLCEKGLLNRLERNEGAWASPP